MDENNNDELPSQRLDKTKQGELSLLEQITTQGNDIKKLLGVIEQFGGENKDLKAQLAGLQSRARQSHWEPHLPP